AQAGGIGRSAGKVQRSARHSLIHSSNINGHAKVALTATSKIAEAKQKHRSRLAELKLSIAFEWVRWIAGVVNSTKRNRLSTGNDCTAAELIAAVHHHARAQMESAAERKDVVKRLHRPQVQTAGVANPILVESATIVERGESDTHVRASSHGDRHVPSKAQQRSFECNPGSMIAQRRF